MINKAGQDTWQRHRTCSKRRGLRHGGGMGDREVVWGVGGVVMSGMEPAIYRGTVQHKSCDKIGGIQCGQFLNARVWYILFVQIVWNNSKIMLLELY